MKDHRLIDERSLAFSHLIADKLRADPALVRHARGNLERWLRDCSERSRPALLEWRELLDGGKRSPTLEKLCRAILVFAEKNSAS